MKVIFECANRQKCLNVYRSADKDDMEGRASFIIANQLDIDDFYRSLNQFLKINGWGIKTTMIAGKWQYQFYCPMCKEKMNVSVM